MQPHGIDTSYHQGVIDWYKTKNAVAPPVEFAFIRACYAARPDTQFVRNWAESERVGILRGAYCYFLPKVPPLDQVNTFVSLCCKPDENGVLKYTGKIPPVLDVEEQRAIEVVGISKAIYASRVMEFLTRFELLIDIKPMIYTSPGFWNNWIGVQGWEKFYELWVANWGVNTPAVPTAWKGLDPLFWQYKVLSDGLKYGMAGKGLDHNYFMGTREEFARRFGGNPTPPPPPPPPAQAIVDVPSLYVRRAPSSGVVIATTSGGALWDIEGVVEDSIGRQWAKVGKSAYLALWLCKPVG